MEYQRSAKVWVEDETVSFTIEETCDRCKRRITVFDESVEVNADEFKAIMDAFYHIGRPEEEAPKVKDDIPS